MSALTDFGIDSSMLPDEGVVQYIPEVPGRVAHMDGDFFAYQVSYDEDRTWDALKHNLDVTIETFRLLTGSSTAVLHLTAKDGTKGGRYEQAMLKPYQETRKDKPKPSRLEEVRLYMHEHYGARYWRDREADDGMAFEQSMAIAKGQHNLSCIVSRDKDLGIVQGLHLNFDTYTLQDVHGLGSIHLKKTASQTKLVGTGPLFFWAQMLMGDPADNISGIPLIHTPRLNSVSPTKDTEKWAAMASQGDERAMQRLLARKPKQCGPAMAYSLLKDVTSNLEAWRLVAACYQEHAERVGFTNYRTGEPLSWAEAAASEARLLWMRTDAEASPDNWKAWHVLNQHYTCTEGV